MSKKHSEWKTQKTAQTFVEGVRGAIPGARLQLHIISEIISAWCPRPSRILDLGCGDGAIGRMLLEEHSTANAVFADFSEPMLEQLYNRVGNDPRIMAINLDFSTSAWVQKILPESSFDIIVSGFAIHHQPDKRKQDLYAELYGLLGNGGVFLNLDQVSSATSSINNIFDRFFLDHIRRFHENAELSTTMEEVENAFLQDKKENIPAPVDLQCQWLRDVGFQDVDCFFKTFELALFGGRKASPRTDTARPQKIT